MLTVNTPAGSTFTFNGTMVSAAASLTKAGPGTQIMAGTLANTGPTTVNGGVLRIDGFSTGASSYTVNSGGTLGGNGIITGSVSVAAGGTLAPGASPGTIRLGNLSFAAAGIYAVELNGPAAGTGYDQTEVIGTVSLGNATLTAALNYVPTPGDKLYIINNDCSIRSTARSTGWAKGRP